MEGLVAMINPHHAGHAYFGGRMDMGGGSMGGGDMGSGGGDNMGSGGGGNTGSGSGGNMDMGGGGSMDMDMTMYPYLFTSAGSSPFYVLFKPAYIANRGAFAGAMVAVLAFAFFSGLVRNYLLAVDSRARMQAKLPWVLLGGVAKFLVLLFHYAEMLLVMSFNLWIILAVLVGHSLGWMTFVLFDHRVRITSGIMKGGIGYAANKQSEEPEGDVTTVDMRATGGVPTAPSCACDPLKCECSPKHCNQGGGCQCCGK